MRRCCPLLLLTLALTAAVPAAAGVVVESVSSANGMQTLAVEGDRARIDPARSGSPGMLFDAGRERLVLLNRPARQYNVIDGERLAALEARVAEQRERLQQSMRTADAAQRQRLRRRLQRLPAPGDDALGIEPMDEVQRVNGFDCRRALVRDGDRTTHRLCIAGVGDLGLGPGTTATLRALFDFLARLGSLLGGGDTPFDARILQRALAAHDAFPVRIERADDGTSWTVRAIEPRDLPAGYFDLPSDYTEGARLGAGD